MKKRKQHYVWKAYLRSWAKNDFIWCCYRAGKPFNTNLINVGQSREFYKLKELSEDEIDFIHKLAIEPLSPHLQKLNKNWVKLFNKVFEIKKYGINDQKINTELDEVICNLEEDLHASIENDSLKYLNGILEEDIDFFKTEEGFIDFIYYLCAQYMRTNKIKAKISNSNINTENIDVNKIWNVLSHIYITNMGWGFYSDRQSYQMVILKNESCEELITGDQPVINTYMAGSKKKKAPTNIEFYYPVSPQIAILITKKLKYKNKSTVILTQEDVRKYNQSMVDESHSQIYAASEDALKSYEK